MKGLGTRLLFLAIRLLARFLGGERRLMVWGPTPLINNKFWSDAVGRAGHASQTLVTHHYAIHRRCDFDLYYDDLVQRAGAWRFLSGIAHFRDYLAFFHVMRHARVIHIPFSGGPLGATPFWRAEAVLYRRAGIKVVVIPYGADAHLYSTILNTSMRNALLIDYPGAGRFERAIAERVAYWTECADCVICGPIVYGMGRWDVTTPSALCIDVGAIERRREYSGADGRNGAVRVVHSPNHRGFKGTEFLVQAVEELREEGLQVELVLLERVPNEEVMATLRSADILVEQLIAGVYALNAIEGMASGVAVLSNLEDEPRGLVFRRYAFLEECPVVSTTPENVKQNLRRLVGNPALRRALGEAGREYAEKYHSYEMAQYLFGAVYAKLLEGRDVDLMNLFHPLKSAFNRRSRRVPHPLVRSRLA